MSDIQNKVNAIANTLQAIDEAYKVYVPLFEQYREQMKAGKDYEAVPGADENRAGVVLEMLASGELTTKGRDRAVESGLIRKITVEKSPALIKAEENLSGLTTDYNKFVADAIAAYSFKKSRGASTGSSSHGNVDPAGKVAAKIAGVVKAKIGDGVTLTFNGRDVSGTTEDGAYLPPVDAHGDIFNRGDIPERWRKALSH